MSCQVVNIPALYSRRQGSNLGHDNRLSW